MVLVDNIQEPVQQVLALLLRHTIDVLHVSANREDALPSGHRVRPDNRVNGLEFFTDVLGCAARLVVQFEAAVVRDRLEERLLECHGEGFQEFLVGFADAVVDFVAAGPEGV